MIRTTRSHLSRRSILGLALFATAACEASPADPDATLAYDLSIELTNIFVVGDCENAPGNPGEFAWRALAEVEVPMGVFDTYETDGFPAEAGAETYSEDDSPVRLVGAFLLLPGIEADVTDQVNLQFSVIEWDQGSHDSEMQFRQVNVPVAFQLSPATRAVDVGDLNACKLSFEFIIRWTESD